VWEQSAKIESARAPLNDFKSALLGYIAYKIPPL